MNKKSLLYFIITSFIILSCRDSGQSESPPSPPFDYVLENNSEGSVILEIGTQYFYPDRTIPDNVISNSYNSNCVSFFTIDLNQTITVKMICAFPGPEYPQPNQAIIENLMYLRFLDSEGAEIVTYENDYWGDLIIPDGQPNAGMHQWEIPSNDRPFYIELDEDGVTGRIIITDVPTGG